GFQLGVVSEDYNILWPQSPLANGGPPLRYWRAHECGMLPWEKGQDPAFVMRFEIPLVDRNIRILQADPFRVIAKDKRGEECLMRYKGDRFILFDQTNNCSRELMTT